MNLRTHMILQSIAMGLQVLNVIEFPPNVKIYLGGAIAAFQAFVAAIAHNSNPDGTSATTAYIPKDKQQP